MKADSIQSAKAPSAPGPARVRNAGGDFAQTLAGARVSVQAGDTLTGMVKRQAAAEGVTLDEATAYRTALSVAKANGVANPDLITPGLRVDMSAAQRVVAQAGAESYARQGAGSAVPSVATPSVQGWLASRASGSSTATPATSEGTALVATGGRNGAGEHPVLDRTLERAVAKGFMPQQDVDAVKAKIETLGQKYGFEPDDFAVMSLMESDGLNPQASNGSCHGVIQFCEGPNRGAASVGYAQQPRAILGLSVLNQLDLVDQYLSDAGGQRVAGQKLDDLYLSVLTPAARAQTAMDAPLPVAGTQARVLYVNQDRSLPITRNSLIQGLLGNAASRLGLGVEQLIALREQTAPDVAQADRVSSNAR